MPFGRGCAERRRNRVSMKHHSHSHGPSPWAIALAFALVYLSWGTTYLAIRVGVHEHHLPPALFTGSRVGAAGWLVLAYLGLRGEPLRLPGREFVWIAVSGCLLFVAGNGLVAVAMDSVHSGTAAVLVATTPLWMALLETFWPGGERLSGRGWLGLAVGLGGVMVLLAPTLQDPGQALRDTGPILLLGSSIAWAVASLLLRYRRRTGPPLAAAAYQMALGGTSLAFLGLALGDGERLTVRHLTPGAVGAFVYLLVVGSLVGFVAFNWLLVHVRATLVGTYAYVNPLVAILVGILWGDGELTGWVIGGVLTILAGVALVRSSGVPRQGRKTSPDKQELRKEGREEVSQAPRLAAR